MKRHALALLLAITALTFTASRANALCLLCTCGVSSSGLNFLTYDPLTAANQNINGNIRVSCSVAGLVGLLVAYDIKLSAGGSNNYSQRQLAQGASKLNYNLYTTAARNTIWGDGLGSTATVSDSYLVTLGAATNKDYVVYGQIPMLQNVKAGPYADSLVISIIY